MSIDKAIEVLQKSSSILVCTGAGMSAECGIPTYRDKEGMWKDLPAYRGKDVYPVKEANIFSLLEAPQKKWGFIEWRRRTIANCSLHDGYPALNSWRDKFTNLFIHTTNTDGLHIQSGWPQDSIYEVHGCVWKLQCAGQLPTPKPCIPETWDNREVPLCDLDENTMLGANVPHCLHCGALARTNEFLFGGDYSFINDIEQYRNFNQFMHKNCPQVAILIGSSGEVPRNENITQRWKMQNPKERKIISINPNVHPYFSDIPLNYPAQEGLTRLTAALN